MIVRNGLNTGPHMRIFVEVGFQGPDPGPARRSMDIWSP